MKKSTFVVISLPPRLIALCIPWTIFLFLFDLSLCTDYLSITDLYLWQDWKKSVSERDIFRKKLNFTRKMWIPLDVLDIRIKMLLISLSCQLGQTAFPSQCSNHPRVPKPFNCLSSIYTDFNQVKYMIICSLCLLVLV